MGRRIRIWEPNRVYFATIRCNDRQFFLKPDHHDKHPLLSRSCPPNSLDPRNGHIPRPSVINIIGAAVARALELHPICVHWIESNINHLTIGYSANADQIANISDFFRTADSIIARSLNAKWEHEGHVWGAPFRPSICTDDAAAEKQFLYCLTNPVKDGLVATLRESPFFTCYRAMAHGKPLRFWRIDWDAYYKAGAARKRNHRPKDYLQWMELELTPLPHQATWPEHKRRSRVRAAVREAERDTADTFRASGRTFMGVAAQYAADPRAGPSKPKRSGPQPLCHSSSRNDRREYAKRWRETARAHRAASIDYRLGYWEREFPEGTFRPPLVTPFGYEQES